MARNPVDKTSRERILAAEKRLDEAVDLVTRCKNCGLDMSDREQALAMLYDRIAAFKSQFLPGEPEAIKRGKAL